MSNVFVLDLTDIYSPMPTMKQIFGLVYSIAYIRLLTIVACMCSFSSSVLGH